MASANNLLYVRTKLGLRAWLLIWFARMNKRKQRHSCYLKESDKINMGLP